MSEFGESLDCLVIGGYFGSGRRGGTISSFLCGLRVGENHIKAVVVPEANAREAAVVSGVDVFPVRSLLDVIDLLKYGSGVPFYRLAGLEENLGIPLPPATQWGDR